MHQLKNGEKHPDLSANRTIVRFRGEIRDLSPNLIRDGSGLLAIAGIFHSPGEMPAFADYGRQSPSSPSLAQPVVGSAETGGERGIRTPGTV